MLCTTSPCFFEHHIVDMSTSHIIEVSEKRVPFSKLQPVALAQPSELRMVGERCSALASLHLPTPTGPVTITPPDAIALCASGPGSAKDGASCARSVPCASETNDVMAPCAALAFALRSTTVRPCEARSEARSITVECAAHSAPQLHFMVAKNSPQLQPRLLHFPIRPSGERWSS